MKNGKYILVKAPESYPGMKYRGCYCYEHHLTYWVRHGLVPSIDECVHHIDKNPHNNRIDNLVLITKKQHDILHGSDKRRMVEYICNGCGKKCETKANSLRARIKKNKMGVFCNRNCATRHQFTDPIV